jgi:hypothetical protein
MQSRRQAFSDLIGSIYDCALDPSWWDHTVAEVGDTLDCRMLTLTLSDLRHGRLLPYPPEDWGDAPGRADALVDRADFPDKDHNRSTDVTGKRAFLIRRSMLCISRVVNSPSTASVVLLGSIASRFRRCIWHL